MTFFLKYKKIPSKMENLEISSTVLIALTAQLAPKQQKNKILLSFIALWIGRYIWVLRHFDVTIAEVSCSKNSAHNVWRFLDSEVSCFFVQNSAHILEGSTLYFFFTFLQECDQKNNLCNNFTYNVRKILVTKAADFNTSLHLMLRKW